MEHLSSATKSMRKEGAYQEIGRCERTRCPWQYFGPAVDILLRVNKLQVWEQRLQMSGVIQMGKFALPQYHPYYLSN